MKPANFAAGEPTPAQSLARSASIFRAAGKDYSADFTASMIDAAEQTPSLYRHWAGAQAKRAAALQ